MGKPARTKSELKKKRAAMAHARKFRYKHGRKPPGRPRQAGPLQDAVVHLKIAVRKIQAGYRSGRDIAPSDPHVILALSALTERGDE